MIEIVFSLFVGLVLDLDENFNFSLEFWKILSFMITKMTKWLWNLFMFSIWMNIWNVAILWYLKY